jgi:uncharacterized protein YjbI with pentapeptide repeats
VAAQGSAKRLRLSSTLVALGALVVLGGLLLLVIVVPPRLIRVSRPDIRTASAADQLKAENDLRTTLVTTLAGVAVAAGTIVAALNFGNSRAALAETQRQNRESSDLQRRGQVTERFSKAIDQLGERGHEEAEKVDVRLGGIYLLEQIARDSPELHWPIVEILTAFIREHTKPDTGATPSSNKVPSSRTVAADVQAALTVLGRRNSERDRGRLYLHGTNLQGAELSEANLQEAELSEANLHGAILGGTNLQGATLVKANLQEAMFGAANLQNAMFAEANLQSAELSGADLQDAILAGANLQKAHLYSAKLRGAYLGEADLKGVDLSETIGLTQEQLSLANCDEKTKPPLGLWAHRDASPDARATRRRPNALDKDAQRKHPIERLDPEPENLIDGPGPGMVLSATMSRWGRSSALSAR